VERDAIEERLIGPAIVTEPTATTYVDVGYEANADELGVLHILKTGAH
jgi:hypothetical protein